MKIFSVAFFFQNLSKSMAGCLSLGTFLFILILGCGSKEPESNINAFEQRKNLFSNKIDRIYLSFDDAFGATKRGIYFPLRNQSANGPIGEKGENQISVSDNAPALKSTFNPSRGDLPSLNLISCQSEPYVDFNQASQSIPNICTTQQCLPINERVRTDEFASRNCSVINNLGSDIASVTFSTLRYSRQNVNVQVRDIVNASLQSASCALVVGGPAMQAFIQGAEKVAAMTTNYAKISSAATKAGLAAADLSLKTQKAAAMVANIFSEIRLLSGIQKRLSSKISLTPLEKMTRSAFMKALFKKLGKYFLKKGAKNASKAFFKNFMRKAFSENFSNATCLALAINFGNCSKLKILTVSLSAGSLVHTQDTPKLDEINAILQSGIQVNSAISLNFDQQFASSGIRSIAESALNHSVKFNDLASVVLMGASLLIPGASCLQAGHSFMKISEKRRKHTNIKKLLEAVDHTHAETLSYLDSHAQRRGEFYELRRKVIMEEDMTLTEFYRYQGYLIPQIAYAFNKVQNEKKFANGLFRRSGNAAKEIAATLEAAKEDAPNTIFITGFRLIYDIVMSTSDLSSIGEFLDVGVQGALSGI